MSSVNYTMSTFSFVSSNQYASHFDPSKRAVNEHENKDINPELSHLNTAVGLASEMGYNDWVSAIGNTINYIDSKNPPKNLKKDRKDVVLATIYIPEWITEQGHDAELQFCEWANNTMKEIHGDNWMGGFCHFDERHEYTPSGAKEPTMSLNHISGVLIPYYEETVHHEAHTNKRSGKVREAYDELRCGIQGAKWRHRKNMTRYNDLFNEACKREYGREYNDGTGGHATRQIADMKRESAIQAQKNAEAELANVKNELVTRELELEETKELLTTAREAVKSANEKVRVLEAKAEKAEENYKSFSQMLSDYIEAAKNWSKTFIPQLETAWATARTTRENLRKIKELQHKGEEAFKEADDILQNVEMPSKEKTWRFGKKVNKIQAIQYEARELLDEIDDDYER